MSRLPHRFVSRIDAVAFCFLALSATRVFAIDLDECKTIEDDPKRLACYDSASGRSAPVKPAEQAMPAVTGNIKNDVSGIGLVARQLVDQTRPGTKASSLGERWDLDGDPDPALFSLRPYKPIYILPAYYSTSPNLRATSPNPANTGNILGPIDHLESKFQFSLKTKLARNLLVDGGSLWAGYTQTSRWQVYNSERSRPFRESDYEPELIYTAPIHYSLLGVDARMLGLSLTHQSNGRDDPQSRSWNRVIGIIGLESGDWSFMVRPWLRIREKAAKDNNSDILDYVGRGEVVAVKKLGNQQIAVTLRHSLRFGQQSHGSVTVDYAVPLYGYLKGHVQFFSGYGESLIDYNHHTNAIGLGISLGEWF